MIIKKIFDMNEASKLLREKYNIGMDFKLELQFLSDGKYPDKSLPCLVFVKNEGWEE